jgi:hypothetical protein
VPNQVGLRAVRYGKSFLARTTAGADIYPGVFASQQAFQSGAAALQTMAYNTIGSLSVIGYVGSTGGLLVS